MPDWSSTAKPPRIEVAQDNSHPFQRMARPVDRLAAVLIDLFVILAPLYLLLSAPFKKGLTLGMLVGSEQAFSVAVIGMVVLAIMLSVLYQTIFHYFFSATLGKMLFEMKVVSVFDEHRPELWDWFVRAWVWVLEVFFLGIPWLSIFSQNHRRPWHDRLADTIVVTSPSRSVSHPSHWERAIAKSTYAFFMAFILVSVIFGFKDHQMNAGDQRVLSDLISHNGATCDVVDKYVDDQVENRAHGRLQLALTLYASGLVDRSCLEAEVASEEKDSTELAPIAYLTKAFIHADEAEISNSYLDEVCGLAPRSAECYMSRIIGEWSEENWNAVEEDLAQAPRGSGYLEVWGVRHYMKRTEYGKALEYLERVGDVKAIAEFSLQQRVKALYRLGQKHEAEIALAQALPTLPDTDAQELSSWVCAQELQKGCAGLTTSSCQKVGLTGTSSEIDFANANEALARVLALECTSHDKLDYLALSDAVRDEDWRAFFKANLKSRKSDSAAASYFFAQIMGSDEAPELLKEEATRRWNQVNGRADSNRYPASEK